MNPLRLLGQAVFWGLAMLLIALLAHWPRVSPVPSGHGELKLSLAHLTDRLQPCRTLSEAERAGMPPNMRAYEVCERARAPAVLEILLDGEPLLQQSVRAAGAHSDGRAYLFRSWPLAAGHYSVELRLRDTPREQGFDHTNQFELRLDAGMSALLTVGDGEATLHVAQTPAPTPEPQPPAR